MRQVANVGMLSPLPASQIGMKGTLPTCSGWQTTANWNIALTAGRTLSFAGITGSIVQVTDAGAAAQNKCFYGILVLS